MVYYDTLTIGKKASIGLETNEEAKAPLHIAGGNDDLVNSEGDLKIGDDNCRLKIGVTKSGENAGDVRIRADGGTNRLMLGGVIEDTLTIQDGKVGIGTTTPDDKLHVGEGPCKLVIGSSCGESLGWGTSYIGFNAGRNKTNNTWKFDTDTSNNGGAVIHSTINGDLYFSAVRTNKPDNAQILTDADILKSKSLVINSAGLEVNGEITSNGNIKANANIFINGNVGIGTQNPDPNIRLHIDRGNINSPALQLSSSSAGWGSGILFKNSANIESKYGIYVGQDQLFRICDARAGQDRLIIDSNGNVGIGKITPSATLDIDGDIRVNNNNIWLRGNGDNNHGIRYNASVDGPLVFGCSGGALGTGIAGGEQKIALHWSSNGNVGIGTTPSPSARLDIQGDIRLTGKIVQDEWKSADLKNGWNNLGYGNNIAGYFRDKNGIVHLRGIIVNGSIKEGLMKSCIFSMPDGYKPLFQESHVVCCGDGKTGRCIISSDGDVIAYYGYPSFFSLDGISFRAAH